MFIETYYDDRAAAPGSTTEPMIPYPELSGEELTVWRKYLPIRRQVENLHSGFQYRDDSWPRDYGDREGKKGDTFI